MSETTFTKARMTIPWGVSISTEAANCTISWFLPIEILIEIFSIAAASSSEARQSLGLVSSWTREIVLPYLYRIIDLSPSTLCRFVSSRACLGRPLQLSASSLVRAAWMDFTPYDTPKLSELCILFPELSHISVPAASWQWMYCEEIWVSNDHDLSRFKSGLHLSLRACDKYTFDPLYNLSPSRKFRDPLALPLALAITHLHLEAVGQKLMRDLECFPELTHVSLTSTTQNVLDQRDLRAFLASRPKLQRLVFVFRDAEDCCTLFHSESLKVLAVLREDDDRIRWTYAKGTAYEDWRSECTGTRSIWDDQIIKLRRDPTPRETV